MTTSTNQHIHTLLDEIAAMEAKYEAIARVGYNTESWWRMKADEAVWEVAINNPLFTTDDVWEQLQKWGVEPSHEKRAMGAIMTQAAKKAWVTKTDRVRNSQRVECHNRPVAVWQSNIFEG